MEKEYKKIALLGGTFDPVHIGHIKVAEAVLKNLSVAEVWFVPAANPPHKEKCKFNFVQRIDLLKEALKNYPKFFVYEDDYHENSKSFTFFLIKELKKQYPHYHFYFVIGADNVVKLKTWYEYKSLLDLIEFVVIDRETADKYQWKSLEYYHKLRFIEMPLVNVSSTEIRSFLG